LDLALRVKREHLKALDCKSDDPRARAVGLAARSIGSLHVEVINLFKPRLMIQVLGPFVSAFNFRASGPAGIAKFQLSLRTVAVTTYRVKRDYDSMIFFINLVNTPVVEFGNDS
jgi:hypothetical protein